MKNFNVKSILLGIGVGIILTSIISMIYLAGNDVLIDDEEIVKRAQELGMVQAYASNEKGIAENKVNAQNEEVTEKKDNQENKNNQENKENTKKSEGSENKKSVENMDDSQVKNIEKKDTEIKDTEIKDTEIKDTKPKDIKKVAPTVNEKKIIVQAGDTSEIVSEKLKRAGLIKNTNAFNDMMDEMGVSDSLTIGEYTIKSGTDMEKIINILTAGG